MKKLGIVLAILLVLALVIGGVSCGGEQTMSTATPTTTFTPIPTPKPTPSPTVQATPITDDGEGHSSEKPVSSFVIKESDDRMMEINCDNGITFSHSYTSDHRYICPNGTVVEDGTTIAIVKNGSVFVDVDWLFADLRADGIQVNEYPVIDETNLGFGNWERTVYNSYELTHESTALNWSWNNPDVIKLDGQTTELTWKPFQEDAERVGYYEQGPRYTKDSFLTGVYYKNRIIFVPIKDFVEPFGYRVEISGGIVSVLK